MYFTHKVSKAPLQVPNNPTDAQRYEMVKESLVKEGRPEDYEYIIKSLSPPPDIAAYATPGQYKGTKVAVVGAGVAGLTAAFELRKLGFDITIFEAEDERIGGRIYTHYFDKGKKIYGELGAGRIPASHEAVWHYINLFNLNTTKITGEKGDTFVHVRGIRARNNPKDIMEKIYPMFNLTPSERNIPWPELYNRVLYKALKSLSPELRSELLLVSPQLPPEYVNTVTITVRQGLKNAGLSDAAIELITSLSPTVNAFIEGSFYTELVTNYAVFTENTYEIDGGMITLPLAFYKSLTSDNPQEYKLPRHVLGKVTFKMGCYVGRVYKSDKDKKVILRYLTETYPVINHEEFDYVFFTIPLTTLRKMSLHPPFSNEMMEAIREVNYVDAQKTLFLCNERFWERQGITGGTSNTDLLIQSIMYPSDRSQCHQNTTGININCNPNRPGVLTASYNIGSDAVRLGNFLTHRFRLIKRQVELTQGLPENYLDNVVINYKTIDWDRNQWITGAFVNFLPGQGRLFLFDMLKPEYENRIYFAGEAYYPPNGWIQAAVNSAMIAVNALAYYLKAYGYK
ncbi:flavin-dependent L-tryptophan oxidase RebO precursor [Oxobacter pfennigii]|uniref:Flavin-dependent L-tryptophan oxidase RebO n=1 Tax=Oxobacter pfennigii TaxID=36849 RepID=A0A0P8WX50_9CLOT|nr:NAD(P)/FAD-dependent oxidoreductase [Oxobacter pfennigii]KPU42893.1 flavin-dependent L-tryptophan oxidase RebO precursor [Oxobacter pfennigii]